MSRDEARAKIRELGGDISESVSSKTDYVVVGLEPGSKAEKAKKLGVKILDETRIFKTGKIMGILTSQLKKLDWGIIIPAVLLVCFGLVAIYSTCVAKNDFSNLEKQAIFFAVGILVMIAVSFFDYRILKNNSYLILIFM